MASTHCPLLALPPELRNRIWHLVLPTSYKLSYDRIFFREAMTLPLPALLQVCHSLRAETLPMFYGLTTFIFELHHTQRTLWHCYSWLHLIGPDAAKQIRSVRLDHDREMSSGKEYESLEIGLGGEQGWRIAAVPEGGCVSLGGERARHSVERQINKTLLQRVERSMTTEDWAEVLRTYYRVLQGK